VKIAEALQSLRRRFTRSSDIAVTADRTVCRSTIG